MKYWTIVLLLCSISTTTQAEHSIPLETSNNKYKTQLLWPDIIIPWGMVQLPDNRILATERSGKLYILSEKQSDIEVKGLPKIHANNQGGLLDVALHPDFANNSYIFFTFSSPEGKGKGSNTALMRAKLDLKTNQLTDKKVMYKGLENSTKGSHYGSRITINGGHIYFSIGDRGSRDLNPQNLSRDGGKIYRLNLDGSIPSDNPFFKNDKANKAIFSYGHRNPQGLITLGTTGQVWSHEHGPKGGDEVNLIEAGKNYGWPVISYGINYNGTTFTDITSRKGMEQPKLYWQPSIAPSGMAFINSKKYPQWDNKVLLGSMKFDHLVLLEIINNKIVKQTKILDDVGRVRNVIQGRDGYIYLGVDGKGILRVLPNAH